MLNFGISAFLKLVCLNSRPQRTELRKRLLSSGSGYDYHRSLRLRVHRLLVDGEPRASISASIDEIASKSERKSVRSGLEQLANWRTAHRGEIIGYKAVTYESASGLFKVTYTADFGIRMGDQGIAVHVWNTGDPPLLREMAYAVLGLFKLLYEDADDIPDDLAVLSLPDLQFYRLSEAGAHAGVGVALVRRVENVMRELIDELELPGREEHPPEPRP